MRSMSIKSQNEKVSEKQSCDLTILRSYMSHDLTILRSYDLTVSLSGLQN